MLLAEVDAVRINVGTENAKRIVLLRRARVFPCPPEQIGIDKPPLLRGERSVQRRRNIVRDHRGFDRDRAGAAHRIDQRRIRKESGKQDQPRAERFGQRRRHVIGPVTAPRKTRAAAIERKRDLVAQDADFDDDLLLRLRNGVYVIGRLQRFNDRLFDDALTIGNGKQRALCALAVHMDLRSRRQIPIPRKRLRLLEQGIERVRPKRSDRHQKALCGTKPKQRFCHLLKSTGKLHTRIQRFGIEDAELMQLERHGRFQADLGGCDKFHIRTPFPFASWTECVSKRSPCVVPIRRTDPL